MEDVTSKAEQWKAEVEASTEPYDPLVTYYFVNKTLDMSGGKIGVQTARAGQVMMMGEMYEEDTLLFLSLSELFEKDFMWGNKSICLKANASQMNRVLSGDIHDKLMEVAREEETPIRLYPVYDIGATEVATNSLTVIAMTPVPASKVREIIRKFQLY